MPVTDRKFRKNRKHKRRKNKQNKKKAMKNSFINIRPDYSIKAWNRTATATAGAERVVLQNVLGPPNAVEGSILNIRFSLGDIPNFSNYVNLWDYYRINYVVVYFTPYRAEEMVTNTPLNYEVEQENSTATGTGTNAGGNYTIANGNTNGRIADIGTALIDEYRVPYYAVTVDRDSSNAIAFDELSRKQGAKIQRMTKGMSIGFAPNTLTPCLQGLPDQLDNDPTIPLTPALLGWKIDNYQNWLDTDKPNIPHYGLQAAVEGTRTPTGIFKMKVSVKYYVSFAKRVS